jgi:hypothetical protein
VNKRGTHEIPGADQAAHALEDNLASGKHIIDIIKLNLRTKDILGVVAVRVGLANYDSVRVLVLPDLS